MLFHDDALLAAVDDIVVVVAQAGPSPGAHRRGVGIGRTDPKIGRAPVAADRRPVRVQAPLLQQPPRRIARSRRRRRWSHRQPDDASEAGRRRQRRRQPRSHGEHRRQTARRACVFAS